jgi:hypothetical protein
VPTCLKVAARYSSKFSIDAFEYRIHPRASGLSSQLRCVHRLGRSKNSSFFTRSCGKTQVHNPCLAADQSMHVTKKKRLGVNRRPIAKIDRPRFFSPARKAASSPPSPAKTKRWQCPGKWSRSGGRSSHRRNWTRPARRDADRGPPALRVKEKWAPRKNRWRRVQSARYLAAESHACLLPDTTVKSEASVTHGTQVLVLP